jgi:acetylornithine deacetylase/succinyl-diaminopimelate desuccinylase-like protein
VHALGRAIAALADLPLSRQPRATLNVGRVEGGTGVNVVAARAEAALDLRSTDPTTLDDLVRRARLAIEAAARREGVAVALEAVGARPAGQLRADHPLVAQAQDALRAVGFAPTLAASSTDANVPLALGIPALALGITRGGSMHTLEEWIDLGPLVQGLQQLILFAAGVTHLPRELVRPTR